MVRQVAKSFTGSHFDDEALFAKIAKEITEQVIQHQSCCYANAIDYGAA